MKDTLHGTLHGALHAQLLAVVQKAGHGGRGALQGVGVGRGFGLWGQGAAHEPLEEWQQEKLQAAGGDVVELFVG